MLELDVQGQGLLRLHTRMFLIKPLVYKPIYCNFLSFLMPLVLWPFFLNRYSILCRILCNKVCCIVMCRLINHSSIHASISSRDKICSVFDHCLKWLLAGILQEGQRREHFKHTRKNLTAKGNRIIET